MRRDRIRSTVVLLALSASVVAAASSAASSPAPTPVLPGRQDRGARADRGVRVSRSAADGVRRGQALFLGTMPLTGRLRGDETPLPPQVVICGNCHGGQSRAASSKGVAPRLDVGMLTEARSRRAGPPSAYDLPSFCKVLRTGVDPVSVLVAREMPTYQIDDAACADLWRFVTRPQAEPPPDPRREASP